MKFSVFGLLVSSALFAAEQKPAVSDASGANEMAIIQTSEGDMVVQFWTDAAPKTVENFKKLARSGFYNGTTFHRVMKGFMIQGGDPYTKDPAKEKQYGDGGPGYTVKAEFNQHQHQRGVIAMAREKDPDSAGSQFFICLASVPRLDGKFTLWCVDVIDPEEYANSDNPIRDITQRFTTGLETLIRAAPEQYLWLHRRWKHEPPVRKPKEAA